jgi:AcrR family transcriptional regulator
MTRTLRLTTSDPGRTARGGTRERVLAEASDLFYTRGIRATTMDDVAERCGILKGSLYYHYPSKESMRDAYLALELSHRLAWLDGLVAAAADPASALLAVVAGHRAWVASDDFRGCFIANAAVEFPGDPAIAATAQRYRERAEKLLEEQLACAGSSSPAATARELLVLLHGSLALAQLGAVDAARAGCDAAGSLVLDYCETQVLAAS